MGEMSELLKDYVIETAKKIVDIPDDVDVKCSTSTKAIIIQIKVSKTDCGKIIGRKGRTIESLKTLCMAIKNTNFPDDARNILLEVLEEEESSFRFQKGISK